MQSKRTIRNAFTLTELVVAATLMVSTMSIIAPLTVRSGRLWHDTLGQQLAIDELSSELERLTRLDTEQRENAIAQLTVSEHLKAALPSAQITARTIRDDDGMRLVLTLDWDRFGSPRPVTLVGWLDPIPVELAEDPDNPAGEARR